LVAVPQRSFAPWWERHRQQKARLGILAILALPASLLLGPAKGLLVTVVTVAVLEFVERERTSGQTRKKIFDVLVPAAYLFLGFVLVFAYNDVIAAVRFYGAYDEFFNRMDSRLMFGATMPQIAHAALRVLPGWIYDVLEFFYYGMFAQIGGGLVISALCFGRKAAFRFAGTIMVAYYLALALFFLWPSQGPFYLCAQHFAEFPRQLRTYGYQKQFLQNVMWIWEHRAISQINTDYYIAFPCMHIAQPLIVLWFLRHWKRMVGILLAYDAIMVVAILLLEWHYAVDLIGGVVVAALAILIVNSGSFSFRRKPEEAA
jgi:PAP2 superfamily